MNVLTAAANSPVSDKPASAPTSAVTITRMRVGLVTQPYKHSALELACQAIFEPRDSKELRSDRDTGGMESLVAGHRWGPKRAT